MSNIKDYERHYCMKCLEETPWAVIGRFRICTQCKTDLLYNDATLKAIEAISEKKGGPERRV